MLAVADVVDTDDSSRAVGGDACRLCMRLESEQAGCERARDECVVRAVLGVDGTREAEALVAAQTRGSAAMGNGVDGKWRRECLPAESSSPFSKPPADGALLDRREGVGTRTSGVWGLVSCDS